MRIALMVEGQEGVTWDEWLALALAAEIAELDGLFRSDHLSAVYRSEAASLEAWTTLAALAAVTKRIRLGTLVTPVTFRHPSLLARTVATVDHVSGGRVELGLGAGWYEREHRSAGIHFPQPSAARFDLLAEQLEIIVRTWTESGFDHVGADYTLENQTALPPPLQQPHPPIILGGTAKARGAALAARWASEYNSLSARPDELAARRARLDAACNALGREPSTLGFSMMTTVIIGADQTDVDARMHAARQIVGPAWEAQVSNWIVGTSKTVLQRLTDLSVSGLSRIYLKLLDHRDLATVLKLGELAREVGR